MLTARRILVGASWLYVLGVMLQFFFAGLGSVSGEGWDAHEAFGYSALHLTPILILIVAWFAKVPKTLLILTLVFAIVVFVQPIWISEFRGEVIGAVHVLAAGVILVLAHTIAQRSTDLLRQGAA